MIKQVCASPLPFFSWDIICYVLMRELSVIWIKSYLFLKLYGASVASGALNSDEWKAG